MSRRGSDHDGKRGPLTIFSIIATCRLHALDPFSYFDEVLRVVPYWPHDRYLELAPQHWNATRSRLDPQELDAPLSRIMVPAPPPDEVSQG